MRNIFALAIVVAAVVALLPMTSEAQQQSEWEAWLFNRQLEQLIRVDADGTVIQSSALPVLPREEQLGSEIAISEDGNRIAICSESSDGENVTLVVYDLANRNVLRTHPLGNVTHCALTEHSFDGNQLAYGVLADIYDDLDGWFFEIMDWQTGDIVHSLNSEDADVMVTDYLAVPTPVYHENGLLALRMDGYATGGFLPDVLPTFIWDPSENRLGRERDDLYGNVQLEILQERGEIIWAETDEDYPLAENSALLPYTPRNVIKTSDKTGQHNVIAAGRDKAIGTMSYAANGEMVIFQTIEHKTEGGPDYTWYAVDRDGNVSDLGELSSEVLNVAPTRGGFAMLYFEDGLNILARYTFARSGLQEPEIIWSAEGNKFDWWIVWSTPIAGRGTYPQWQNVAP